MAFLSTMNIISSGMTAQQLRLDVISENITNQNTTRTENDGGAYRRKVVVFEAESGKDRFRDVLAAAAQRQLGTPSGGYELVHADEVEPAPPSLEHLRAYTAEQDRRLEAVRLSNRGYETAGGVRVAEIMEDPSELPLVYDPEHPDANEEGYVEMPNVTMVKEITDAMAASQAFSANVTAFNTLKDVVSRGLEIGR